MSRVDAPQIKVACDCCGSQIGDLVDPTVHRAKERLNEYSIARGPERSQALELQITDTEGNPVDLCDHCLPDIRRGA